MSSFSVPSRVRIQIVAMAATAVLLCGGPAAASITWSAPVDSTGHGSDVINTGVLIDAQTFGATTTVNGVTFVNTGLGVPNTSRYGVLANYGQFTPGWDAAYSTLVATTAYLVLPSQLELDLGVLPKDSYVMQLFMPQWDANWATAFSLNGVVSAPVQAGGFLAADPNYPPRSMPQWISVRFDADGVTDYAIDTEQLTSYQLLAAFQLRTASPVDEAVPEPTIWAMLILGFGLTGGILRQGSRRGGKGGRPAISGKAAQPFLHLLGAVTLAGLRAKAAFHP
jgi:hypothetical protein